MDVSVLYGRGQLGFRLPANVEATIVRKPVMPVLPSPEAEVRSVLAGRPSEDFPTGVSLNALASGAGSACIAICDITRPVPNHLFLRPMIEMMWHAGIARDKITVLVATGLHRPNTGTELEELIGDAWVTRNVQVQNHFARDESQHVTVGTTTRRKTLVKLDRRFVEADLRIATGLVEPHFMAGYSGGRKVIAPGLAHADTITTFHSARFMADPAARNCNLDCNPLHEEQLEIVRMLGEVWGINTVIDENRNLAYVNFGDVIASHARAVQVARQYCEVRLPRRFKTVVTSAAGYPLDKTYYQTIKGMVGAANILAPGGDLIIASQCSEGLGSPEFVEAQRRMIALGQAEFLRSVHARSHAQIDEWQTQMQVQLQAQGNVTLVSSGLKQEDLSLTGVQWAPSIEHALQESLARQQDHAVAIIPEGPYVVPFCASS